MNAHGNICAVVPVKDTAQAKQRLAGVLSPTRRQELALAMLEDVLAALTCVPALAGIVVVTIDPAAAAIATRHGAHVASDGAREGHTGAVAAAARRLATEGFDSRFNAFSRALSGKVATGLPPGKRATLRSGARSDAKPVPTFAERAPNRKSTPDQVRRRLSPENTMNMLVLPGDIPLVQADDVRQLMAVHGSAPAFTIVPARDERGSNAILCSPACAVPLRFGDNSFFPHLAAAKARGIEPKVVQLPRIALDIDTPDDLTMLLATPLLAALARTRTHALLDRWRVRLDDAIKVSA